MSTLPRVIFYSMLAASLTAKQNSPVDRWTQMLHPPVPFSETVSLSEVQQILVGQTVIVTRAPDANFLRLSGKKQRTKRSDFLLQTPLPERYRGSEAIVTSVEPDDSFSQIDNQYVSQDRDSPPASTTNAFGETNQASQKSQPRTVRVTVTLRFPDGSMWKTWTTAGNLCSQEEGLSPVLLKRLLAARQADADSHLSSALNRRIFLTRGNSANIWDVRASFDDFVTLGTRSPLQKHSFPLLAPYRIAKVAYSPESNFIAFKLALDSDDPELVNSAELTHDRELTIFEYYPYACTGDILSCLGTIDFVTAMPTSLSPLDIKALQHGVVIKGMRELSVEMLYGGPQHTNLFGDTQQLVYLNGRLLIYIEGSVVTDVQYLDR